MTGVRVGGELLVGVNVGVVVEVGFCAATVSATAVAI
jgi:hypothetical protein